MEQDRRQAQEERAAAQLAHTKQVAQSRSRQGSHAPATQEQAAESPTAAKRQQRRRSTTAARMESEVIVPGYGFCLERLGGWFAVPVKPKALHGEHLC